MCADSWVQYPLLLVRYLAGDKCHTQVSVRSYYHDEALNCVQNGSPRYIWCSARHDIQQSDHLLTLKQNLVRVRKLFAAMHKPVHAMYSSFIWSKQTIGVHFGQCQNLLRWLLQDLANILAHETSYSETVLHSILTLVGSSCTARQICHEAEIVTKYSCRRFVCTASVLSQASELMTYTIQHIQYVLDEATKLWVWFNSCPRDVGMARKLNNISSLIVASRNFGTCNVPRARPPQTQSCPLPQRLCVLLG